MYYVLVFLHTVWAQETDLQAWTMKIVHAFIKHLFFWSSKRLFASIFQHILWFVRITHEKAGGEEEMLSCIVQLPLSYCYL